MARDNITLQQILYIARDRVFGVYLTAVISGTESVVYYTLTCDNCYSNTNVPGLDKVSSAQPGIFQSHLVVSDFAPPDSSLFHLRDLKLGPSTGKKQLNLGPFRQG